MQSLNKTQLIGNVGNDPDYKESSSGLPVVTFSMATTERFKNKDGDKKEETTWHRVVAFGNLASIIAENVTQGAQLYVEGKIRNEKWTDKNGVEQWTTKIVASNILLLGKNKQPREPVKDYLQPDTREMSREELDDEIPF